MSLIEQDLQQIYINQNKLKIIYFQSVFKLGGNIFFLTSKNELY